MTTNSIIKGMRRQVEALKKEPKRELSITDVKREGILPWARHHRTIIGIVRADMHGPNLLKAKVSGKGRNTRYTMRAENIIRYLETYGPALMSLGYNKAYGAKRK